MRQSVRVLDPGLEAALTPILDDLVATGEVLLDVRETEPRFAAQSFPGYAFATVCSPDGSVVGIGVCIDWPRAAQVAALAEQMQEIAMEARWGAFVSATWPECPQHPNSHPLAAALIGDRAVWRCPTTSEVVAEIGTLPPNHEMHDDLGAPEYEVVSGISKTEYESRLVRAAEHVLLGRQPDGDVESVRVGDDHAASTIDVVFRAHQVPGRRFGWRIPVWPAPYPAPPYTSSPEDLAVLFPVYLMELINRLPWDPDVNLTRDEEGVEWIDEVP